LVAGIALSLACGGALDNGTTLPNIVDVSATANDSFSPRTVQVFPGDTIRWTNADADNHSIEPDLANPAMDSDAQFPNGIPPNQSFTWTIPENTAPGTRFFYHCRFHGQAGNGTSFGTGMTGVIDITPIR
jgi:plastocyanin